MFPDTVGSTRRYNIKLDVFDLEVSSNATSIITGIGWGQAVFK